MYYMPKNYYETDRYGPAAPSTRIRSVDPVNHTITVEAGVTLIWAQESARGAACLLPLSLAAEGSCTIGGNLATNAGGPGRGSRTLHVETSGFSRRNGYRSVRRTMIDS
jgi:FAD/FMN-containing dehydrogenase